MSNVLVVDVMVVNKTVLSSESFLYRRPLDRYYIK